ncbi:MAG: hypothetical protein Ct9H90mP13_00360 [Pseudomonadota bacterium]|nr:MAG: hypothetical protein Ct9H90mP13_00360 [Pseudomonadota bacterium]
MISYQWKGFKLKLSNEIRITSGKNTITAGQAIYDESGSSINVSGGVTLENSDLFIEGQSALINTNDETAVLKNTQYFFPNIPARGRVKNFELRKKILCFD